LIDELVAQDYVDHSRQFQGLEHYKQHLRRYYTSFPDSHETIENIIAEGDKVCIRLKGKATHKGEYCGLAPTGKKVTWEANTIFRIVKGKIAEMWGFSDELNFLKQLGVIKDTGKALTFTQK
jgi:C-1 hydroxylase